jgi:hypothetical protein
MEKVQLIEFDKSEEALPKFFNFLLHKLGQGFLMAITGGTGAKVGTGKSLTAIRIAEMVDPNFTVDDVCFYPSEFLKRVQSIRESRKTGRVLILDETEITAPSTAWHSIANKTIAQTIATFRYLKCMCIVVTPTFSWIDKRLRSLVTFWGYPVLTHDGQRKRVSLYFYKVKTDLLGDSIYFQKLRFWDRRNRYVAVAKEYRVNLPSEDLVSAYNAKQLEFKDKLGEKLLREARAFEESMLGELERGPRGRLNISELADLAWQSSVVRSELSERGRVSAETIRYHMPNLGATNSRAVAAYIRLRYGKASEKNEPGTATSGTSS